jgi:uncharacterized membrane protein
MALSYAISLCLHMLAAAYWVGGMAALLHAVRPAAIETLDGPARPALLAAALARFLTGVAAAIVVLLLSGMTMVLLAGGLSRVHWSVHAMLAIGIAMMALFGHVRFAPYARLQRAVEAQDWPTAAHHLGTIRRVVAVNLALGIVVFVVAIVGRAA